MEKDMIQGTCKWFSEKRGYGFIEGEDGKQYFVHYSKIVGQGIRNLQEAQRVSFRPEATPKGPIASDVTPS